MEKDAICNGLAVFIESNIPPSPYSGFFFAMCVRVFMYRAFRLSMVLFVGSFMDLNRSIL